MARYTADAVAIALGIHVDTLRRRCAAGVYQHHRSGRVYYFTDDDLAAIEEAEKVPARKHDAPRGRTAGSQAYHDDVASGERRYTDKGRATRIR